MRFFGITLGLLLCGSSPALGQGNMLQWGAGGPRAERQRYHMQVRREIDGVLAGWQRAWDGRAHRAVAELYLEGANLFPAAGGMVMTRPEIESHFQRAFPGTGRVQIDVLDFGTSGEMAYVTTRFSYSVMPPGEAPRPFSSVDLLVLRRERGVWRIQSHMARDEGGAS